jgi:WD40 repeat protein
MKTRAFAVIAATLLLALTGCRNGRTGTLGEPEEVRDSRKADAGTLQARAEGQDSKPDPSAQDVSLTLDPGHHVGPLRELLFTPDGRRVLSAGEDGTIQVWDASGGERLRVYRPPFGGGHGAVMAAALATDGNTLACWTAKEGKGAPNRLVLLNLEDGRLLPLAADPANPSTHAVAFSPDGKRLAAGHGTAVDVYQGLKGVWDRRGPSPHPWQTFPAGAGEKALAFSPDGSRLAAFTYGDETIRLWDLDRGGQAPLAERSGQADKFGLPVALAWSPDGKRLVCGHFAREPDQTALSVWSAEGKELQRFSLTDLDRAGVPAGGSAMRVARVFFRGDRKLLMMYHNHLKRSVALFDLDSHSGQAVVSYDTYQMRETAGALAPDGKRAAMAAPPAGSRIALFDVRPHAEARFLRGDERAENEVGWAKDGYAIAWRGPGQAADTWLDLKRLQRLTAAPGPVLRTVTQRDGWTLRQGEGDLELSGGGRPPVTVQSVGRVVTSFTLPAAGDVAWVAWTGPAGLHLADAGTGKMVRLFQPPGLPMGSLASSPDGKYLLVYSIRGVLHVYRPDQEKPLLTVFASGPDWVVWTEAGYYAATPGGERLVGWAVNNGPDKLATFYPAERFRKTLYRPDVVKLVLEKGSVKGALEAANADRKKEGETVAAGVADMEQLLPPRAALEILDNTALPKVKVKATAAAAAEGQPVKSLRLLVDGRPLPDGQAVLELKAAEGKAEATWQVTLPPGEHELKALARSRDTGGASAAVPVAVPAPAPGGAAQPTLYVIAVGIDKYPQQALQLKCAVADARGLAEAFGQHCAGKGNLFGAVRPTTLIDPQATRKGVLDALKKARQAVKPGDLLVFSFAGHGARQGQKFYLLTVDANPANLAGTALSGDDLRAALADMPCQVLLLLDACHSAAGVRAFTPATDEAARGLTDDETGVAVLCAAMGSEEAQEKDGHGLFSKAVIEALGRADRVPFNYRDGRQYVHHLGSFVFDEVKVASHDEQHPFLTMPYVTESFPLRRLPDR